MTPWHWIAIAVLVLVAWAGRYDLEAVGSDGRSVAYVLDRWTGDYYLVWPQGYRRLTQARD